LYAIRIVLVLGDMHIEENNLLQDLATITNSSKDTWSIIELKVTNNVTEATIDILPDTQPPSSICKLSLKKNKNKNKNKK